MRQKINFKDLSARSLQHGKLIVSTILPRGRSIGNEWVALNPHRSDETIGSFKVNVLTGRWADFATGDSGGDFISLIAYVHKVSQFSAAEKLLAILGGLT
jgi:hypothetical protein